MINSGFAQVCPSGNTMVDAFDCDQERRRNVYNGARLSEEDIEEILKENDL
tara:strand:+ start:5049 stop:5201 length:153 start_codon:yes stop_codon:yes gene_type:complete